MTEKEILEQLVKIRRGKKISQKEMAKKLGIGDTYLSTIERGLSNLSVRRFIQICEVLQVTPQYVWGVVIEKSVMEEGLLKVFRELLPEEKELLIGIAQMMCDRRYLRR